jgi:hypothetical protein
MCCWFLLYLDNDLPLSMLFAQQWLAALGFVSAYIYSSGNYAETIRGVATCTLLRFTLGSSIIASSGAKYTAGVAGAWNFFNTQYAPACIVFPREASHVQAAMKTIFKYQVRYAVQAGGHSAMKGWNKYVLFFRPPRVPD